MSAARRRFTRAAAGTVLTGAVAFAAVACSSSSDDTAETKTSATPAAEKETKPKATPKADENEDVKITKSGFAHDDLYTGKEFGGDKAYVVHYAITNHGKGAADYFVGLEFLDKDGDTLGSTGVTADKLGAGKTNTGTAAPMDVEIDNGKISDITSVKVADVQRTSPPAS